MDPITYAKREVAFWCLVGLLITLLLVLSGCAKTTLQWNYNEGTLERSVMVAEDAEVDRVCIQWSVQREGEGARTYEYRCVSVDTLRRQLFPESF